MQEFDVRWLARRSEKDGNAPFAARAPTLSRRRKSYNFAGIIVMGVVYFGMRIITSSRMQVSQT